MSLLYKRLENGLEEKVVNKFLIVKEQLVTLFHNNAKMTLLEL